MRKKILILGDARHGKDTLAECIERQFGYTHLSSSVAALDIFLFDQLKRKFGFQYKDKNEAYDDRIHQRDRWYDEICAYNKKDPTRLVKEILKRADIYVGLRSGDEVEAAIREELFDYVIGIYNYRLPRESAASNTAYSYKYCDIVFNNNGTVRDLEIKVNKYFQYIL
jgi:hypothetical protein